MNNNADLKILRDIQLNLLSMPAQIGSINSPNLDQTEDDFYNQFALISIEIMKQQKLKKA